MASTNDSHKSFLATIIVDCPTELYFLLSSPFVLLGIAVVTIFANVTTIYILMGTRRLRTYSNSFIVSMSANDVFFLVVSVATYIEFILAYFANVFFLSDWHWTLFMSARSFHMCISYGNIIVISIERWLYITQPFVYHIYITKRRVTLTIVLTWIIAFLLTIPFSWVKHFNFYHISRGYVLPAFHGACFLVLLSTYGHITFVIWRHVRNLSKHNITTFPKTVKSENKVYRQLWKSAKFFMLVCGLYLVLITPYVIGASYLVLTDTNFNMCEIFTFWFALNYSLIMSHFSNLFVYALKSPGFKQVMNGKLRHCKCCCKHPGRKKLDDGTGPERETENVSVSYKVPKDKVIISVIIARSIP